VPKRVDAPEFQPEFQPEIQPEFQKQRPGRPSEVSFSEKKPLKLEKRTF